MKCFSFSLFLLLSFTFSSALHPALEQEFDSDTCRSELQHGLKTLLDMSHRLSAHEARKREREIAALEMEAVENFEANGAVREEKLADDKATTAPPCPVKPMTTIFPPPSAELPFLSVFPYRSPEDDIFLQYMNKWASLLKDEESVCNGPSFESFSSVTMEQIYGFFSIFSTNYAQPLCSTCKKIVGAAREEFLQLEVDENVSPGLARYLLTQLPSTESFCSILMPACHEVLLNQANSDAESDPGSRFDTQTTAGPTRIAQETIHCLGCQLCMSGTMLLEHKFLLDNTVVQQTYYFLRKTFVTNLCAELCYYFPPGGHYNSSTFPDGADYNDCMSGMDFLWNFSIQALKKLMIPNQFCPRHGFCQKYETPNILHCLKGLCHDLSTPLPTPKPTLKPTSKPTTKAKNVVKFSYMRNLCNLLPDHPEQLNAYLNIHQNQAKQEKKKEEGRKRDEF